MNDLQHHVNGVSERLSEIRVVRTAFYFCAADDRDGKKGFSYFIKSPNVIMMPEKTDVIKTDRLEDLRRLWLKNVDGDKMMTSFVRAAKHPVPSDYKIELPVPEPEKGLRADIIGSLIPFEETRAMFLRLERDLDLPMREILIAHTPVNGAMDTLHATIN